MLKNSGDRLLTHAARNGAHAFPITYRAATGGSGPARPFFQRPAKRVLIVAATSGYQTRSFVEAALDDPWGNHAIPVRFENPEAAAEVAAAAGPVDGVVRPGDRTADIALPGRSRLLLSSRMLKNSGNRLLTDAARNGAHAFPITYRAATGGRGPTGPFFQHPTKRVLIVAVAPGCRRAIFREIRNLVHERPMPEESALLPRAATPPLNVQVALV